MSYYSHPTSVIDEDVSVGSGTSIWHWVHLSTGVRIGDGCSLGQNVFVGKNVEIGNNCKIQNNVSIYEGVTLEDDVFCGPSMVFTNVGNPRAAIVRKDKFKKTIVKKGTTIGANATIVCGITLGESSFIAAGAVVIDDVPDFALMAGVPAVRIGWMSKYGERIIFPEGDTLYVCPYSGEKYRLTSDGVKYVK